MTSVPQHGPHRKSNFEDRITNFMKILPNLQGVFKHSVSLCLSVLHTVCRRGGQPNTACKQFAQPWKKVCTLTAHRDNITAMKQALCHSQSLTCTNDFDARTPDLKVLPLRIFQRQPTSHDSLHPRLALLAMPLHRIQKPSSQVTRKDLLMGLAYLSHAPLTRPRAAEVSSPVR